MLFGIAGRFGLPGYVDRIVLGLFLAGFVATVLLLRFRAASQRSPVVRVAGVLAIALVCSGVALGLARWLAPAAPTADVASIAVLPCDYQGEPKYAYLGPGLADEVHARLAGTSSVHVPSFRAVRKALEVTPDQAKVAQYLHVDNLTRCRIDEKPDHVVLSAEVVEPKSRAVVWSGTFQYASVDPLSLVSDLTNSLVSVMMKRLGTEEAANVRKLPTSNRAAYEQYLLARQAQGTRFGIFYQNLTTRTGLPAEFDAAREHYLAAIELDPGFAAAYAGLARLEASNYGQIDRSDLKSLSDAKDLADKALQLNPCEVDALITLSYPWMYFREWGTTPPEAQAEIKRLVDRAVECEPNSVDAWQRATERYLSFQFEAGLGNDAAAEPASKAITRAYELDPTNCQSAITRIEELGTLVRGSSTLPYKNRLSREESVESLETIMALDPGCGLRTAVKANVRSRKGRFAEAIAWGLHWHELQPKDPEPADVLAGLYTELGLPDQTGLWECRAQHLAAQREGADDCASQRPRPSWEPLLEGNFETELGDAPEAIANARKQLREGRPPDWTMYIWRIGSALAARREDLAVQWLNDGLRGIGSNDPADLMPQDLSPRRTIMGKMWALILARACQAAGRDEDARRLTDMGRVSAGSWDPGVRIGNGAYLGVWAALLDGDKQEAIRLLDGTVQGHATYFRWFYPGRHELMFDHWLDPLRKDPLYAPQLDRIVKDYEAWVEPSRRKALEAEATGNWEPLRVL
jgi:TolB-like protein/tetratricopeptide (TPR) repeat protein